MGVPTPVDATYLARQLNALRQRIEQVAGQRRAGIDGTMDLAAPGPISISSGTAQVSITHTTTSAGASAFLSPTGLLQRVVSSRRYKTRIRDAAIDPLAVLAMRPRQWRDRAEVEAKAERRWYTGFIAEELDALGLKPFVVYDEQGRPDAIEYDRLTAAIIPVLQMHQEQIQDLAAAVDVLADRVAALEAKAAPGVEDGEST